MSWTEPDRGNDHDRLAWLGYSSSGVVPAEAWDRLIAAKRRGRIPRRRARPGQYGHEPDLDAG
jgi:hypothetical protein